MTVYYLDTSAALKLLVKESHSQAFAQFYDEHADASWVSSSLLRVETARAVARALPQIAADARELLLAFDYIAIDGDIIDGAMNEPTRTLRSLDAIHLATARVLGSDLDGLVTYDDRLSEAATTAGLPIVSPCGESEETPR